MDFKEKIKPEPIDDYETEFENVDALRDHDYCKNPKQEELMEPKLEEPDYFEMDRPSEIPPELPIFEYPEYLKLESFDDYGSKIVPAQTTTPNNFANDNGEEIKRQTPRCSVCSIGKYFMTTKSKNRKIILVLGAVLGGKMSISKAQSSLQSSFMTTCPKHYWESINEIFKILEINHVNQMNSSPRDKKANLMSTAKSLDSTFTFTSIFQAVNCFFRFSGPSSEAPLVFHPQPKRNIFKRSSVPNCSICFMLTDGKRHTTVGSTTKKLILMVGAILSGKKSVVAARLLLSTCTWFTCRIHLSEAINEIFRFLKIKKFDEMQSCSVDKNNELMAIVRSLCPEYNLHEFCVFLEDFIRCSDYIQRQYPTFH